VCSYSGNTGEALSCFEHALARRAEVVCVSSGGELLERAHQHALPVVVLPEGYPPRAALGYSFAGLLGLAWASGIAEAEMDCIEQCVDMMEQLGQSYGAGDDRQNSAIMLAEDLVDLVPLIYCTSPLGAVGLRWKNQLCENSKKLAFVGILPEMVHNDIMGWEHGLRGMRAGVILLKTPGEAVAMVSALEFLKDLVGGRADFLGEFEAAGSSLLSNMFSLILLGDFTSAYLALIQGLDPTPIATIDKMKSQVRGKSTEA
jgi:glucose/mannose-6-phosphate isomerase